MKIKSSWLYVVRAAHALLKFMWFDYHLSFLSSQGRLCMGFGLVGSFVCVIKSKVCGKPCVTKHWYLSVVDLPSFITTPQFAQCEKKEEVDADWGNRFEKINSLSRKEQRETNRREVAFCRVVLCLLLTSNQPRSRCWHPRVASVCQPVR